MHRPLSPGKQPPVPTEYEAGWVTDGVEKSLLHLAGIRTPDRRQLDTWIYGTEIGTWYMVQS